MSYAVAQPPPAKPRPGVVSVASILLYVTAALLLIQVVLSFASAPAVRDAYAKFEAAHPSAAGANNSLSTIVGAVVQLVLAAGFVTLAVLVGKGKQPARIVAWVLCGLGVLCVGCGTLLGSLLLPSLASSSPELADLTKAMNDAIPPWQAILTTVLSIATLLILVTVIILLALPAANDFFRKEQEVWVPPTGAYPGGYPPAYPTGYPQVPPPVLPPTTPTTPPAPPSDPPPANPEGPTQ